MRVELCLDFEATDIVNSMKRLNNKESSISRAHDANDTL